MGDNIATKIEDNEPCPCGEGGNYDSCHGRILVQNHWRALKTKEVYSEILNSSRTALKKYYEENAKIYAKKMMVSIQ